MFLPHRLLVASGALVDRAALRVMEAMLLSGGDPNAPDAVARHDTALRLYGDPNLRTDPRLFFRPPCVPEVEVTSRRRTRLWTIERLRWPSNYRCFDPEWQAELDRHEANAYGHAEWIRHGGRGYPTVVCVHSWATGWFPLQRVLFDVESMFRAGMDVLLFMLPFHGPRTPATSRFGGQLFPGTMPHTVNEGMGQAIWDLRGLLAWLRGQNAGPIGMMGMSLGGYTTAMMACLEPDLAFTVPIIPAVSIADLMWIHGEGRPARRLAEARGVTLDVLRDVMAIHTPLRHQPQVPREARMIVAGLGDRVCPPEHVVALWEHWEQPRILWFPGSHIAHFGRSRVLREVREFAAERFAAVDAAPPVRAPAVSAPRTNAAPRAAARAARRPPRAAPRAGSTDSTGT
jgi:hypothetical protein